MDDRSGNLAFNGQSFRRVEVLSGAPCWRRRSADDKASIVAESVAPGAVARSVAPRHGLHPNQLYAWRRERAAAGVAARDSAGCSFVPTPVASVRAEAIRGTGRGAGTLEIAIAGLVLRIAPGVDMDFLGAVLRAAKSA